VVIGNTSSGKSSALSMVSGIRLPSASKLTTRCPIEINLSHDDDIAFQGKVFVRKDPSTLSPESGEFVAAAPRDDANESENQRNLNTFEEVENEIAKKQKVFIFIYLFLFCCLMIFA
jgi:energy-coupling factor transporter ATP-binding protein EcfA2